MNGTDRALGALAEDQFGVFARWQAAALGLSEPAMTRRVMTGAWEELLPGVYRLPGTPRTGRQRAMAATLWGGDGAAVSFTTAGRLLRLDGVRADRLHLTVPLGSGLRPRTGIALHRTGVLAPEDRTDVDGIACTSATRTVIDCAAMLGDEALETAFESARRMGLTSAVLLRQRAAVLCGRGRPGSARVARLLAHQRPGDAALEYRLEVKVARLLRASSLPTPVRQHPVGAYRIDFAYPQHRVGIEAEGFEYHGSRLAWKRDKRRIAQLELAGWRLVFVTWDDVTHRPDDTRARIALALSAAA